MRRALVVTDDPMIAGLCADLFRQHGYRSIPVKTAREAIRSLVAPEDFDAAYFDMALPDGSGRSLAALAQRLRPELPVLLGSLLPEHLEEGRFIPLLKPFTVASFALAMRAVRHGLAAAPIPVVPPVRESGALARASGGGALR